jgi:hypothetical protein
MQIRFRYLTAIMVNAVVPWLAYRFTLPHYGPTDALAVSSIPLLAWIVWDLARHRHFDALSAVVLAGTLLSLAVMLITGAGGRQLVEKPLVSGAIGVFFLVSLAWRRPLVFYLARSTMARESRDGAIRFEALWHTQPHLPGHIRLMTLVWGLGLTGENALRACVVWHWPGQHWALVTSDVLQYAFYVGLTGWTVWYRSARIRKSTIQSADLV